MDTPTWKPIPNYEGLYEVSDIGQVRSLTYLRSTGHIRNGRVLNGCPDKEGYLQVALSKSGKPQTRKIHRLVMLVFVGESTLPVNHKDGDKKNNTLNNLEYVTPQENTIHAISTGLFIPFGWDDTTRKLAKDEVLGIKELLKTTKHTFREIGNEYHVKVSVVSHLNNGRTWKWLGNYQYPIRMHAVERKAA